MATAELKRRTTAGALVDWTLNDDGSSPVADAAALAQLQTAVARLADVVAALAGTLTVNTGLAQPVTDAQLRATPLSVDTGLAQPQTDGLTDAQLRAAPLPVDTGLAQPVTDVQLRAAPLAVDAGLPATYPLPQDQLDALTAGGADGLATEATLRDVARSITDVETRLDYDGTDPRYVGKAIQGTATSVASWTVQRLDYDAGGLLVRVQVLSGISWDGRATAGWTA